MSEPPNNARGWFKAMRADEAIELIRTKPNTFLLAYVMAHRARWREGFNAHGLGQGESFLGDYENCGMSEQQYRTAKAQLAKWKFATFRATNKGTVGKLVDTRLFSTSIDDANDPNNGQLTDQQRTANGQLTTNEEGKKGKKVKTEKKKQSAAPPVVIPEVLNTHAFGEAWKNWLEHLRQKRKPATNHAQELQLKKLTTLGPEKAIETLNNCIEKNWQGIYDNQPRNNPANVTPLKLLPYKFKSDGKFRSEQIDPRTI